MASSGGHGLGTDPLTVADLNLVGFIRSSIPSVWALDVLLLMQRSSMRSWTPGELVAELRASDAVVLGVLNGFQRDGLLAKGDDGGFRFAPATDFLEDLTVALGEAYAERPVAVINAIVSTEENLQTLADAFRFKPKRP